jgi:hypothetical protein
LPRKIHNAQQLKEFNPYLLADDEEYEEADFEGINEVSYHLKYRKSFRDSLSQLMIFLMLVAKDGDLC